MRIQLLVVPLLLLVGAACQPTSAPQAGEPQPTVAPPTATPSAAVATAALDTPTPADWSTVATAEGDYYVLGNPTAPVRLIDYSDFL